MAHHTDVKLRIEGASTSFTQSLYVVDCFSCGVVFAIPTEMEQRRRNDGRSFYCPNGHSQCWSETEEDRLRKQLKRREERLEVAQAQLDHARSETQRTKRQLTATKGQLTKARKRAANGVCPDETCKRSFTDVADHVRTCHPELVEALT